jgi:hypothetical protein
LYFNKLFENQKKSLLKEYENLKNEYISYAKMVERSRLRFSSKYIVRNKKSNEIFLLKSDFKSYLKNYFNTIIQRLIYNKQIAKEKGLIPFFITFTLPSEYHPFKTYNRKKWELNENFKFNSIQKATEEGYFQLTQIFRYFYKTLKTGKREIREFGKEVRYNGFFEYHKTFIPHFHFLVYIPEELTDWIYAVYDNTLEKFGMNPDSNKIIEIKAINEMEQVENENNNIDALDGAVLYISKYISKNLKEIMDIPDNLEDLKDILDSETFDNFKIKEEELYTYIGWKLINNIRIFRGNNTKLGVMNYKKIYGTLTEEEKNKLLDQAKQNKTCFLYEIEKLAVRYTKIIDDVEVKKKIVKNSFKYKIIEVKEKVRKIRYTTIYQLFQVVKIYDKLSDVWEFDFNTDFIKARNKLEQGIQFQKFLSNFRKFISRFDFIIKYHLKRYKNDIDVDIDKNFINSELNTSKYQTLENIALQFEGKEQIFKDFIQTFIKQFRYFKNRYLSYYRKLINSIENEINTYYQNFKKWIESDLSFSELFFRTDYKIIKHKIYKDNNINIYDKNDYILELIYTF